MTHTDARARNADVRTNAASPCSRPLPQWTHAEEAQLPSCSCTESRLDAYRHRAALFHNESGQRGRFYVEPDQYSSAISGRLWWTTWSAPQEFVTLWMETPEGRDIDTCVLPDDLDDELDDWDHGQFRYLGEIYSLTWLDDATTLTMRRAHIGDV